MLGRYVKAQLWVLLCGGLVGPIFLIVFFVADPGWRFAIQWMFWVGLVITAADVLIALAIANHGAKSAEKTAYLEQTGVLGIAHIVGIVETGTRVNNQPLVKLQLRVEGPGVAPFEAQDRVLANLGRLPNITARKLVVLVDPSTQEYQIDWDRSNLVNGLVPAQFTVEADNRTYDLTGQSGPLLEILQLLKAHHIPLHSMIDVRANPAARQQLQDIVRRAAGRQAQSPPAYQQSGYQPPGYQTPGYQPPTPSPPAAPQPSIAARLQELETLRATGALTDAEYTARRAQIISEI